MANPRSVARSSVAAPAPGEPQYQTARSTIDATAPSQASQWRAQWRRATGPDSLDWAGLNVAGAGRGAVGLVGRWVIIAHLPAGGGECGSGRRRGEPLFEPSHPAR